MKDDACLLLKSARRDASALHKLGKAPPVKPLSKNRPDPTPFYNHLSLPDLETGESRALTGHTGSVNAVAMLPDGRRALSGSYDHTLRLWDLETGESRALTGHTGSVNAVAMLPDGRRALSGADDWTLILWDLESAGPIAAFIGDAEIRALAIAREDLFVAGSANGAIHILKPAGLGHAQARIQWRPPSGG